MPFDIALKVCGKPLFSLANNLVVPVNTGSTTFSKITPEPLANPFKEGPTNVNAPINAVPSAPNFSLFLNTAAAYSFGSFIFASSSNLVLDKALSKKLPFSSPNISPTLFCPIADTVVSAVNAGKTQYPPNLAISIAFLPAYVLAAFSAAFFARLVLTAVPINFLDTF